MLATVGKRIGASQDLPFMQENRLHLYFRPIAGNLSVFYYFRIT